MFFLNSFVAPKGRSYDACVVRLRLGPLGAVLRTTLPTIGYAGAIECATDRVVTNARQILNTAATNQHDTVFLQIMAFAAYIARHFETVGQAYAGRGVPT